MNNALIRPGVPSDIEIVRNLYRQIHADHKIRNPNWFPNVSEDAAASAKNPNFLEFVLANRLPSARLLVCEADDQVIGFAMAVLSEVSVGGGLKDKLGTVFAIAVRPDKRRLGYGRRLIAELLRVLKDSQCTTLAAQVWDGNNASEQLFRTSGFEEKFTDFGLRIGPALPEQNTPGKRRPSRLIRIAPDLIVYVGLMLAFGLLAFLTR